MGQRSEIQKGKTTVSHEIKMNCVNTCSKFVICLCFVTIDYHLLFYSEWKMLEKEAASAAETGGI